MKLTQTQSSAGVIDRLKREGRRVIAAALGESALTLGESPLRYDDCIVIGNEGHGVSDETLNGCTDVIRIPMSDKTESLNAAVAASVLMWMQGLVK